MTNTAGTDNFLILFDIIGALARRRLQTAERAFAGLGLNHTEARLLVLLNEAGGSSTQETLSGLTFIDRTNVGRALKHLEEEGYTVRRKDSADRRSNRVQITAKGHKAVAAMAGLRKKMAEHFFGDLGADDARAVVQLLQRSLSTEERDKIHRRANAAS